jgi:hypothetical protein
MPVGRLGTATILELAKTAWSILFVFIRRRLQLLNDAKAPNNKLVDLEPTDSRPADRQATNSESADGQRANRNGRKRQRPDRLRANHLCPSCCCPDFDRWTMIEPRLRIGSINVGDACTAFTR